jgi:hypothetical protein
MYEIKVLIDIYMRKEKSTDVFDKIAERVMRELSKLKFEGLFTIMHTDGTNHLTIHLNSKKNLTSKVKKMEKIKEIGYFVLWIYPKDEIFDAISDHDYFKAFALSSSTYEYFGKTILLNYIMKKQLPIKIKKITGLKLDDVIKNLYNYKLISKGLKSDMTDVNKLRINFIHYKLFRQIVKEDFQKIVQNIPKLKRSINKLEKIYEHSNWLLH